MKDLRRAICAMLTVVITSAVVALAPIGTGAAAAAAPEADPAEPVRIMLYGDSTTHGTTGDWTWRYRLWQSLTADGTSFDFVGPRDDIAVYTTLELGGHAYRDPDFDDDHASLYGMRFSNGQYQLADLAPAHDPDVVVAMIGGNDLVVQISPDVLEAKWRKDIARLRAANRDVSLVLVPLPQTWIPGATEYNERLADIAAGLDTARSRVVLADLAVFNAHTDTYDYAHFTAAGERKIATVVSAALQRIGVGSGVTHFSDPASGMTGWAPTPRATADGTSVTISWDPVTYASSQSVYVRDLTTGRVGVLHGVKGTSTTLPGQPGARYRIWLAPAKGYVALGTWSTPVDVTVPTG